jgi:protein subunit release factor A
MKRVIEIRAAEGGDDSKLFVKDLAQAYCRFAERKG